MYLLNRPFYRFLLRWLVSAVGLYIAAILIGKSISYDNGLSVVFAGLVLAIINTVLKPFLIILSLPALVFTLGLFMIVINGVTVYIASKLYTPLHVNNFWAAIFAGMVIGLVNYLVTTILEGKRSK
jgi:putative membrane protein